MSATIQEFASQHDFYLNYRKARSVANLRKVECHDLGPMAAGSYGLFPRDNRQTMRVYAVRKVEAR